MSAYAVTYPIMGELIEPGSGLVRFETLPDLHDFLTRKDFVLIDKQPLGAGFHLFYQNEDCYIRVKTHGSPPSSKHRVGQAHLVVTEAEGPRRDQEWASATRTGFVWGDPAISKRMKVPDTVPVDWQMRKVWALATHFNFKVKVLEGGEKLLAR